ncbi:MAG: SbcC/MukB-like Walker B domain-containing protein [Anaerococcus hydrogenalis]|uniref:SbcC/MukB-like Walker B domain-containing protein n=1 Tax=Anaerococcus hydrogenalis TaxID=33029 RepID=UPI0028FF9FD5|nr:SbcC/MukB-like Walker B domain-containing protein [Anaerococcus hydrogenalis]MDU2582948.1 SbcC/MukB-like Walker B domain-containing protein [Anaerococcus hydrogenalis]
MKPISLEMYGFMTYKNKTFIDFSKLYDSKIFIISGDTGSGKTSIFDAISFALFGEIQREGFNIDDLRSDFLNGNNPPTYVDFIFDLDGKKYRIKRIPKQKAKKTRSNVQVSHSVEFYKYEKDKEILISDGPQKTDEKIIDLIGLNFDQLNRVMILAQGEFSKFLKSSSDDKAALLSKIFSSYIYKDIEEKLKEASKDSKKNLEFIANKLKTEVNKNDLLDENIDDETIKLKNFSKIEKVIKDLSKDLEKNLDEKNKEKNSLSKILDGKTSKLSFYEKENEKIRLFKTLNLEREEVLSEKHYYENLKNELILSEKSILIKPYYDNLLDYKKNYENIGQKLEDEKINLYNIEKNLRKRRKKLGNLEEIEIKINQKKENIVKNEQIIKKFNELFSLEKELEKNIKNIELSKEYKKKIDDYLVKKESTNDVIRNLSNSLLEIAKNLEKIKDQAYEIKDELRDYQNLYEKSLENDKKVNELQKLEKELEKSESNLKNIGEKLKLAEESKKSILINQFRKELEKDGICPICGSIYNEKVDFLEVRDFDLEKIRNNYMDLKIKVDFLNEKNSDLKNSIDNNLKNHKEYEKNLNDYRKTYQDLRILYKKNLSLYDEKKKNKEELDQKANLIESNLKDLKNKLDKFKYLDDISDTQNKYKIKKEELSIFNKKQIEESLEKDRNFVNEEEKRIKILSEDIQKLENKKSSSSSLILNYDSDLKTSKEKIIKENQIFEEKVKENFEKIDEFLKYLKIADDLLKQKEEIGLYFEKLNNISIRIESLKEYKNTDMYQTEKIKEEIENLKENIEIINDSIFSIRLKNEKLLESEKEINKIKISLDKSKNDDEILYKLTKVCDGSLSKVSGREKINFETFVLSNYFNKILTYANLRLKDMSDGQFKMLRKKETSDKRKNNGLDIEILDYNTGKIRSEASLSGGETFIASLALALGLSDEISGENGGIKIDTLFIDEGFGSLSDDYLEKAIRTIEKLSYDNKFIGLISHVKELKNAIDAKIEVKYSKTEGSSLKVVV